MLTGAIHGLGQRPSAVSLGAAVGDPVHRRAGIGGQSVEHGGITQVEAVDPVSPEEGLIDRRKAAGMVTTDDLGRFECSTSVGRAGRGPELELDPLALSADPIEHQGQAAAGPYRSTLGRNLGMQVVGQIDDRDPEPSEDGRTVTAQPTPRTQVVTPQQSFHRATVPGVATGSYDQPVRIATWNVNSLKARLPRVEEWVAQTQPDVLCLQETKLADAAFPSLAFEALGYESAHCGEGRWNGVAIISRVGLDDVVAGFADDAEPDPEARLIWATCAGVRVASVYVPNGRALDDDHYQYKLAWLERLRGVLDQGEDPTTDLAICGDFNIAPDDRDVWDPAAMVDVTHVSPAEREALTRLEAWGLVDPFRRRYEAGGLYSWWDYRAGNFHKGIGMRIDLILATESLVARSTSDLIDRNARKGQKPSDHAPVIADFADAT